MIDAEDLEPVPSDGGYKDLDGKHHRLFRDILKKVRNFGGCIAFLGYENQTEINNVMPLRVLGYNYTVYMKQIQDIIAENMRNMHSAYARVLHDEQKLMPVATFVLYFGKEKWERPLSLMDILDIPENEKGFWRSLISDYTIKVIPMDNQPEEIRKKYQSDYKIIADYLAYRTDKESLNAHLREERRRIVHVEQVLDMLHALSSDKRFEMIKEQYLSSEKKEECDSMCLLLDMCEEEGIKKGIKEGIKEGISLSKQILRLDIAGKTVNEISEELGVDAAVVSDILDFKVL